jgi:hypothetical protein
MNIGAAENDIRSYHANLRVAVKNSKDFYPVKNIGAKWSGLPATCNTVRKWSTANLRLIL